MPHGQDYRLQADSVLIPIKLAGIGDYLDAIDEFNSAAGDENRCCMPSVEDQEESPKAQRPPDAIVDSSMHPR